jgi:hypothetical protein
MRSPQSFTNIDDSTQFDPGKNILSEGSTKDYGNIYFKIYIKLLY